MEVHVISRGCLFQAGTAGGDSCDEEMVDSVIARMTADPMDAKRSKPLSQRKRIVRWTVSRRTRHAMNLLDFILSKNLM